MVTNCKLILYSFEMQIDNIVRFLKMLRNQAKQALSTSNVWFGMNPFATSLVILPTSQKLDIGFSVEMMLIDICFPKLLYCQLTMKNSK